MSGNPPRVSIPVSDYAHVQRRQWSTWETEVDEFVDAGDTIVAIGAYRATAKTTGTPVRAAFAHVFTIAGGRVIRLRQFTDTACSCGR